MRYRGYGTTPRPRKPERSSVNQFWIAYDSAGLVRLHHNILDKNMRAFITQLAETLVYDRYWVHGFDYSDCQMRSAKGRAEPWIPDALSHSK